MKTGEEGPLLPREADHAYPTRLAILFTVLAIAGLHLWTGFIEYDVSVLNEYQKSDFTLILMSVKTAGVCFAVASIHLERYFTISRHAEQGSVDKINFFKWVSAITTLFPAIMIAISWCFVVADNFVMIFAVPAVILVFIVGLLEISVVGGLCIVGFVKCLPSIFEFYCQ